ncbi:MAG: nickel pincer cofactor biosynthesis protein LarB [Candidatus Electrothrix sp. GW3-4]|uniref:nickel pincer cofactor biosynthesis protein LarB n=1 Tax=Candidatus Electrothrix sp. GW3-4 TaxID=3126740 RepID=UPI0030CE3616
MNEQELFTLLQRVKNGRINPEQALKKIRLPPVEVLDSARLDHHRVLRTGLPEAIFGENKTVDQLIEILRAMLKRPTVVLATRIEPDKAHQVCAQVAGLHYHKTARLLVGNKGAIPENIGRGTVMVVTAGTSDLPVAEEARLCLTYFGHPVDTLYDAGVAGIHRILAHGEQLQQASALIVVAGMEGALPSVVAGMTPAPVIACPSSIGYGTGAGGFSALLGMLNSCAAGMAVVNIDNGFGAACMAAAINRKQFDPASEEHFLPPEE